MRQFSALLFIYLLFILQTSIIPVGPDLVLLTVIVFALHENRLTATLLGFWAGLGFDLTNPALFGGQMLAFGILGYSTSVIRNLFYRNRWHTPLFACIGFALKTAFAHPGIPNRSNTLPLLFTLVFTLLLSPFAEPALIRLFYRRKSGQPPSPPLMGGDKGEGAGLRRIFHPRLNPPPSRGRQ